MIEVDSISQKPDNISFADASGLAMMPSRGATALAPLEEAIQANLKPGQRILLVAVLDILPVNSLASKVVHTPVHGLIGLQSKI